MWHLWYHCSGVKRSGYADFRAFLLAFTHPNQIDLMKSSYVLWISETGYQSANNLANREFANERL